VATIMRNLVDEAGAVLSAQTQYLKP